jgi:hypothetical protein
MHEIRSVRVLSVAKVMGTIYFILGEIVAFFLALAAIAHGHPGRAIALLAFFGAIQGVIGFIFSAVGCWLYNQVAARIGGVEVQMVQFGS